MQSRDDGMVLAEILGSDVPLETVEIRIMLQLRCTVTVTGMVLDAAVVSHCCGCSGWALNLTELHFVH
jgi:hypothetical protein